MAKKKTTTTATTTAAEVQTPQVSELETRIAEGELIPIEDPSGKLFMIRIDEQRALGVNRTGFVEWKNLNEDDTVRSSTLAIFPKHILKQVHDRLTTIE